MVLLASLRSNLKHLGAVCACNSQAYSSIPEEAGQQPAKYHGKNFGSQHFRIIWSGRRRGESSCWSVMDAIEHQESQADLFKMSSRIYMHCCDLSNLFTFTVPSLPFLRLEGLFGHFSFMDSPSERRMCILPLSEPLLRKLNGYKSPAVVDVRSSVIFEVCFYFCQ